MRQRSDYRKFDQDPEDVKERCAVSDLCDGVCRETHLEENGRRCPAWYTDDMIRRRGGRGRR